MRRELFPTAQFITLKLNVPIVNLIIGQSLHPIAPSANIAFLKTPLLDALQLMPNA